MLSTLWCSSWQISFWMGTMEFHLVQYCCQCTILAAIGTFSSSTLICPTATDSSESLGKIVSCSTFSVSTTAVPKTHHSGRLTKPHSSVLTKTRTTDHTGVLFMYSLVNSAVGNSLWEGQSCHLGCYSAHWDNAAIAQGESAGLVKIHSLEPSCQNGSNASQWSSRSSAEHFVAHQSVEPNQSHLCRDWVRSFWTSSPTSGNDLLRWERTWANSFYQSYNYRANSNFIFFVSDS